MQQTHAQSVTVFSKAAEEFEQLLKILFPGNLPGICLRALWLLSFTLTLCRKETDSTD
jgi:hypothetical protein